LPSSFVRYFEGIQGDTSKKGELFGIENIFKFHEDKLATKMAVREGAKGFDIIIACF